MLQSQDHCRSSLGLGAGHAPQCVLIMYSAVPVCSTAIGVQWACSKVWADKTQQTCLGTLFGLCTRRLHRQLPHQRMAEAAGGVEDSAQSVLQKGALSCLLGSAGYMERYTKSLAKQAVAEYAAVAKKHGVTPTELALAWCKQKWQVASTIIGATSMDQLKVRELRLQ